MGMFDHKGRDASPLISDACTIATSTTLNGYDIAEPPPSDWVRLSAADLGLSLATLDERGAFKNTSTLGARKDAVQSHVIGKDDAGGTVTQNAFSIANINSQTDKAEQHRLVDASRIRNVDDVLDAAAIYAAAHGLDGSDVLVTANGMSDDLSGVEFFQSAGCTIAVGDSGMV